MRWEAASRRLPSSTRPFTPTLSPAAYTYAVPYDWLVKDGIRRYGFHGLSYQYASRRAAQLLGESQVSRLLVCHLGSGASLVRDQGWQERRHHHGFHAAGRFGDGDTLGIHRSRESSCTCSGIKAIQATIWNAFSIGNPGSQRFPALRATCGRFWRRAKTATRARDLAFDVYLHSLVRHAGMMAAVLGGLDALVFTGGVGENSEPVREALCKSLGLSGSIDRFQEKR